MEFINKVLCGTDSPLAKVAYALTVGARDCWCCTFYRGCHQLYRRTDALDALLDQDPSRRTAKEVAKATNNDVEFQRLTELLDRTYAQLNKQMLDSLD